MPYIIAPTYEFFNYNDILYGIAEPFILVNGIELFTEELKMLVVQYVLDGHTRRETSEKFGVSCTPIEKWVNLYKLHGAEGLLSRNPAGRQKSFDSEFRVKVLQYKQEHSLSCTTGSNACKEAKAQEQEA